MLSYHVHPGSGPYLLLVHGALSNNAQWTLNLDALSRVCRPVTAELLGHGDSPSPADPACYRPEAYIDYFESIRLALGAEQWLLCGYSLGASLTLRYALNHPERVIAHALTNSRSAFADQGDIDEWRSAATKTLAQAETEGEAFLTRLPYHPRFATRLAKTVYQPLLARAGLLDPQGVAKTLAYTAPAASCRTQLGDNTRPALLLHGNRERAFAAYADYAAQHMACLTVKELPAGHAVNMQAPEPFNDHMQEFITAWDT